MHDSRHAMLRLLVPRDIVFVVFHFAFPLPCGGAFEMKICKASPAGECVRLHLTLPICAAQLTPLSFMYSYVIYVKCNSNMTFGFSLQINETVITISSSQTGATSHCNMLCHVF